MEHQSGIPCEFEACAGPSEGDLRTTLSADLLDRYRDITIEVADALRSAVLAELRGKLSPELKTDKSFVTRADLSGELAVRRKAAELLPEAGVLGEEQGHTNPSAPLQFVTDPVDGTMDLIRGLPTWGSVLALYYYGRPIVGIVDHPGLASGSRVCAVFGRGLSADGVSLSSLEPADCSASLVAVSAPNGFFKLGDESDALKTILGRFRQSRMLYTCFSQSATARGVFDATVEWNLRLWDLACLRIMVEEAGGVCREIRRISTEVDEILYTVVAGRKAVVEELVEILTPFIGVL